MKIKLELSQYVAEFIGTFFMVFFGCGAIILSQISHGETNELTISLAFGGSISIMIYAVGHISGAHFNPAVTLAFWIAKRFPSRRVPCYLLAQFLGALLASTIHCLIWGNEIHDFGATTTTINLWTGFMIEMIISFSLMFVIISVATDSRAVGELAGIAIGSTVAVCALVMGPLTGASMNPARTLAPAVLSGNYHQLWVYLFAPILGTVCGALVYDWIRCQKENISNAGCC